MKSPDVVEHDGQTLEVGSTVSCYFSSAHNLYYNMATSRVLYAILWPTIIFIISFICVFFSAINACDRVYWEYPSGHLLQNLQYRPQ